MSLIELKNASYQYRGTQKNVIKNMNLEFEKGKLYVIMGKSGAGKSTLLSLLSGLDLPTEGDVLVDGRSMKDLDRDHYRSQTVGVIFQGYNLLTTSNAIENIVLSMKINGGKYKNPKETALGLLQSVGIDGDSAHRKVLKLSGGEQQRVGIARALAYNPDIIIADEPTGNLDHETSGQIMSILQKLAHEENRCVIVVTHSREVSNYADELWGLNKGNLVFVK